MGKIKQLNILIIAVFIIALGIVFVNRIVRANDVPIIVITNPTNGSQVSGVVSIEAEASSSAGIQIVDFQADGISIASDSAYPYSVAWDTTLLDPGSWHSIIAVVYDWAGQTAVASISAQITPLPTPTPTPTPTPIPAPQVSITNPKDGDLVKRGTTVTIAASASDTQGIAKVEFYVNNTLTCTDTMISYTCAWKVPVKYKTSYTLTAKAYNFAGITSSSSIKVNAR